MESFNPFTFEGRLGRMQYFGFGVVWGLIVVVVGLVASAGANNSNGASVGAALVYLVLMIVFAIATLSYGVRRLHDFDKSGWWYLLGFVPFANVVLGLILLFAPGTQGPNTYGVRVR